MKHNKSNKPKLVLTQNSKQSNSIHNKKHENPNINQLQFSNHLQSQAKYKQQFNLNCDEQTKQDLNKQISLKTIVMQSNIQPQENLRNPILINNDKEMLPLLQQNIQEPQILKRSSQQIINYLINQVAQNICQQICKNNIQISSQPTDLNQTVKKKGQNQISQEDKIKLQYQNLLKRKEKAKQQLVQLQNEQSQLKRQSQNVVIKHQKVKYEMSEEQKQRWRQFRLLQRLHHLEYSKKKKIYDQQFKKYQEEQLKLQLLRNQQKSQQKRRNISLKIGQIQQRHQERTANIQQQKKIIQRLKSKKKLFQKMEEQFLVNKQKQQNEEYEKLMNQYKSKRNVNMNQIKNYQKIHQEIFQQHKIDRQRRMSQLIGKSPSMFHSRFLQNVLEQQQNKKLSEIEKANNLRDLYDKRKDYGKIINEKFKPKLKQEISQQKKQMKTSRSMSAFDIQQKGNQYMKKVNGSLANLKNNLIINKQKEQSRQPFKYKNYLKQLHIKQTSNGKNQKNKELQIIQNIMKKQNMTQEEKFYQARFVAQKIQGKGPQRVLDSINAKIQILRKFGS